MADVYIVTGVPGAGKTALLNESVKALPGFTVISFGTVMLELCRERHLVSERDEMRKLPPAVQKEVQEAAAEKIARMGGKIILDTHCTIKTPTGYIPGLPPWILSHLKPKVIILVDAEPIEIRGRRKKDSNRPKRDVEDVSEIEEHRLTNTALASTYSAISGALLKIIHNHEGDFERSLEDFVKTIRDTC